MTTLPSYNDSIDGFVPPPSYQDVIITSSDVALLPNDHSSEHFYHTEKLQFLDIQELEEDITDDQVLEFFEAMNDHVELLDYEVKSTDEIKDVVKSVEIVLEDKLKQIKRNASFIEKRIITKQNSYYINNLRISTFKDFMRISTRIVMELSSLYEDLYFPLNHFNALYQSTLKEINNLESELSLSIHSNSNAKKLTSEISSNLYKKHYKLIQIKYNLNLIQSKINALINCDDVSYVLKERARVYNDAKQIVFNQQRSAANHL